MKNSLCIALALTFSSAIAQEGPIKLQVDATDAPRKTLHAHLNIPAKPGDLTLLYPKWIPGEHGPTGPITDLAGVKITVAGKSIPWRRDDVDMYAFHLDVPEGVTQVEADLDFVIPSDSEYWTYATARRLNIAWWSVLLYPAGFNMAS